MKLSQEQPESQIPTQCQQKSLEESLEADPYSLFLFAMNSPETKEKYVTRLNKFFDHIGLSQRTIQDRCKEFVDKSKTPANSKYAINSVIRFLQMNKDRVQKKEITGATVRNHVKTIKLFCEMNDILLPWKRITKGLPKARRYAEDRAPTIEEIRRIAEYPDRRIKAIVYTMCSSGIRLGAWDSLKWKHVVPTERNGKITAAKLIVYPGDPEQYFTFITPKAYFELEKWMNYRRESGEEICVTDEVRIPFSKVWDKIATDNAIEGNYDPKRPYEYDTKEFGKIYRSTLCNFISDIFGAVSRHTNKGSELTFRIKKFDSFKNKFSGKGVEEEVKIEVRLECKSDASDASDANLYPLGKYCHSQDKEIGNDDPGKFESLASLSSLHLAKYRLLVIFRQISFLTHIQFGLRTCQDCGETGPGFYMKSSIHQCNVTQSVDEKGKMGLKSLQRSKPHLLDEDNLSDS